MYILTVAKTREKHGHAIATKADIALSEEYLVFMHFFYLLPCCIGK
jgi:hypothetical protein